MILQRVAPCIKREAGRRDKREGRKKNIKKAVSPSPVLAISRVAVSLRTAAFVIRTHRLPNVTDSIQKLMIVPLSDGGA